MQKVRKLNFALNVGKGKTNGKTLLKVVPRLYIPPRTTKKRNNEKKDKATKTTSSTAHKRDITTQQQ